MVYSDRPCRYAGSAVPHTGGCKPMIEVGRMLKRRLENIIITSLRHRNYERHK